MGFDDITTGSIVAYAYLWRYEALAGQSEGLKSRPCAVTVRVPGRDHDLVYLMPITTKSPGKHVIATEIPQIEKKRAGLDTEMRQWIILQEVNVDIIPGSFVLEPDATLGSFSKAYFQTVMRMWKQHFSKTVLTKRR